MGYCAESPIDVLKNAFFDYNVTQYNGYELLEFDGFKHLGTMVGLGITPVETPNMYGVKYDGNIKQLLQLEKLSGAKRNNRISDNDIKNIISRLNETYNDYSSLRYSQTTRDKQEIANIIEELI